MHKFQIFTLTLLSAFAANAQPSSSQTSSSVESGPPAIRRVSIGVTLSVLGLNPISAKTQNVVTTTPAVDAVYTTANASQRIGYGLTSQVMITERIGVVPSVVIHRVGYKMNSDIYEGVDKTSTPADDRTHTVKNEDTRARFLDIPVTVRYYGKDRSSKGARWFVEGGASWRRVSNIKTSIDTTVNSGDTSCCDNTPAVPKNRGVRGIVAGFGLFAVDPFGIRVIPQVRYTRWSAPSFQSFSTVNQRNELEACLSLSF